MMELHGEDSSRYRGGAGTFDDSWLLLNGLKREAFQLDNFGEMFPNWYELHEWYKNIHKCVR